MTTWIALTEATLTPLLTVAQRETLNVRPAKDGDNDALIAILADVTGDVRDAIRGNEDNILSANGALLPPELMSDAAWLCIELLEGRIPGFVATEAQLVAASTAAVALSRVRSGSLPVSVPDAPESTPSARTSFGPEVVSQRDPRVSGDRLRGL